MSPSRLFKTCPACGAANLESAFFCDDCGADIADVTPASFKPNAAAVNRSRRQPPTEVLAADLPQPLVSGYTISCPHCEAENPSYAVICGSCGEEIPKRSDRQERPAESTRSDDSTARGAADEEAKAAAAAKSAATAQMQASSDSSALPPLFLLIDGNRYECHDRDYLGREGSLARSHFAEHRTVSRRHLQLLLEADGWYLVALEGVRNTTQLDGRELVRGEPHRLSARHVVQLSSKCSIRLEVDKAVAPARASNDVTQR